MSKPVQPHRLPPPLPGATELAQSIRQNGATLNGLSQWYRVPEWYIRSRLIEAGYSPSTGQPDDVIRPTRRLLQDDQPLSLSAGGGSGAYVGANNHDGYEGLPIDRPVIHRHGGYRSKPTGLDWDKIRHDYDVRLAQDIANGWKPPERPAWPDDSEPVLTLDRTGAEAISGSPGVRRPRRIPEAAQGNLGRWYNEIARRYDNGESSTDLARRYGVTSRTMCKHLRAAGVRLRDKSSRQALAAQRRHFLI